MIRRAVERTLKYPKIRNILGRFSKQLSPALVGVYHANNQVQRLIELEFLRTFRSGERLSFRQAGFRAFSQVDEDGIILYVLTCVGMAARSVVEMCCGEGIECNAANLILNHGFTGLLLDGDQRNIDLCRSFYNLHPDSSIWPPVIKKAWITRDNVNSLLEENGVTGEIDLLSIDLDGIDYWLWEALTIVSPRLVVVEFQDLWGDTAAVTAPYAEDFKAVWIKGYPDNAGASLPAFVKLAKKKGYRLIGANRLGFNAFFLRNDLGVDWFPEVTAASCVQHPKAQYGAVRREQNAAKFPWIEV